MYLYLAAVIGGTVWFDLHRASVGWSFWWNVPVTLIAIVLIGAGQHQLSGLAHEASTTSSFATAGSTIWPPTVLHVPAFSSTHHYRLQHLAHHQFVNDPERDPDMSQLKTSGHWLDFPVGKGASSDAAQAALAAEPDSLHRASAPPTTPPATDKNP